MTPETTDELKTLNPQIEKVKIGTRNLREIKLYPLSMADQLTLTACVVDTLQKLFSEKGKDNIKYADTIRSLVAENLGKILTLITDEGEVLLKDITNSQACDIAEFIYTTNYEVLEKKVKGLMQRIQKAFQLPKSQVISSEDTLSTDLNIASDSDIEKED